MRAGKVLMHAVFEIGAEVPIDEETGCPVVIPLRALHAPATTAERPDGASMVAD